MKTFVASSTKDLTTTSAVMWKRLIESYFPSATCWGGTLKDSVMSRMAGCEQVTYLTVPLGGLVEQHINSV